MIITRGVKLLERNINKNTGHAQNQLCRQAHIVDMLEWQVSPPVNIQTNICRVQGELRCPMLDQLCPMSLSSLFVPGCSNICTTIHNINTSLLNLFNAKYCSMLHCWLFLFSFLPWKLYQRQSCLYRESGGWTVDTSVKWHNLQKIIQQTRILTFCNRP